MRTSLTCGAFIWLFFSHHVIAKVPQITLQSTCDQSVAIFVGRVETIAFDTNGAKATTQASFVVETLLLPNANQSKFIVYFQPGSSVSPVFDKGKSYVVFARPFLDGYATVNGDAGAFQIDEGHVIDSALFDGVGEVKLTDFLMRVCQCIGLRKAHGK